MHKITATVEKLTETISAGVLTVNATTLSKDPNHISRYPSVKNRRKLLKKYDDINFEKISFVFCHLRIAYRLTKSIKVHIDIIKENNRDAQLSRNNGESTP